MRFAFGKNWRSFISLINDARIAEAERAICTSLARNDLSGLRILDIGSGSGLSSLAMRRLGAQVVSFDYDPDSVACTKELRHRFCKDDEQWQVLQGSVLDADFMASLGQFDVVYAWGVLHHTGSMWPALSLTQERVVVGGQLLIALYNDQGWMSKFWWYIKRLYCSGRLGSTLVTALFYPLFALYVFSLDVKRGQLPGTYAHKYLQRRGMSVVHDWRDWLGGFPFEVATPGDVISRLNQAGFSLDRETLTRGWGCNEFVLTRRHETHGI